MNINEQEFTKAQAIKVIKDLGMVPGCGPHMDGPEYHQGESGDHGYGSRLYFYDPAAGLNKVGNSAHQATASKVGPVWRVSIFGEAVK